MWKNRQITQVEFQTSYVDSLPYKVVEHKFLLLKCVLCRMTSFQQV
jgi:hypothetical protein